LVWTLLIRPKDGWLLLLIGTASTVTDSLT
jgi:hypothetical protein